MKKDIQVLHHLLKPLQFSLRRDNRLIWTEGKTEFIIEPFSTSGRESQGYRIYFNGTPEAGQFLFDRSIGCFSPTISGIEFTLTTNEKQSTLIKKAERARFTRGSLSGLYDYKGVVICIFPSGEVSLQIRNRKFKTSGLSGVMKEIEHVVTILQPQEFNLFSFIENTEEGVFAS